MTFRIEYFNETENKIKLFFIEAIDSNDAKNIWNQKYRKQGRLVSICDKNKFEEMYKKYGYLMEPVFK